MYTTLRVEQKTKAKLENLKEYKRETFDELLNRLADNYPEVKDDLVKDIINEADDYYKKGIKHRFSSSDDIRKLIEG